MPYLCPICGTGELTRMCAIELPPAIYEDEFRIAVAQCEGCGFRGATRYRESRQGALDSESWHYTGYKVEKSELESLETIIRQCPDPSDRWCECAAHKQLHKKLTDGIYDIESIVPVVDIFDMTLTE
jgi:hypothetical protein